MTERRWTCGLDYIRLTTTGGVDFVEQRYAEYRFVARKAANEDEEAPTCGRPWSFQGYKGAAWATAAAGKRDDGCILQISGPAAHNPYALDVGCSGVPRLDIACTVWGLPSPEAQPRKVALESLKARMGAQGRPWEIRHIDGFGNGDTCYLGSRTSETFIRIYDKERESPNEAAYKGAVRYEVEFKGRTAEAALFEVAWHGGSTEVCVGLVAAALLRRGVSLPDWIQVEQASGLVVEQTKSDAETSLAWLATQVAPTIRRLASSGVSFFRLCDILGLDKLTLNEMERLRTFISERAQDDR